MTTNVITVEGIIEAVRGKYSISELDLKDESNNPVPLTGWTVAELKVGLATVYAPQGVVAGQVQQLTFDLDPASGSYDLVLDDERATIQWDDDFTTIQTKLLAFKNITDVVVTGVQDVATGITITFQNDDAGIEWPLFTIENNTVQDSLSADVTIAPSITTNAVTRTGLEIFDEACGRLRVHLDNELADLLTAGQYQGATLTIRKGSEILNIKPLAKQVFIY